MATDYVDKKQFSADLIEYSENLKLNPNLKIPDKIGKSIILICEGLGARWNFSRYTYRDEMVLDAIENCFTKIKNYDPNAPTKAGKPNPFGYFTQIAFFAFVRRIKLEHKEMKKKARYIQNIGIIDDFLREAETSDEHSVAIINDMKQYFDNVYGKYLKDDDDSDVEDTFDPLDELLDAEVDEELQEEFLAESDIKNNYNLEDDN